MYGLLTRTLRTAPWRTTSTAAALADRLWWGKWPEIGEEGAFVPKVDLKETETALEVTAEVPGLKPEEIDISLTGDVLTIKGAKRAEREETKDEYYVLERRWGSFERSFRLPVEVDREKLDATHKNGVVTVTLPKALKTGPERIEVTSG